MFSRYTIKIHVLPNNFVAKNVEVIDWNLNHSVPNPYHGNVGVLYVILSIKYHIIDLRLALHNTED